MGIYDRDYYRAPARGGFGQFDAWSVTTWLIVVNIAVFFADITTRRITRPQVDPAILQNDSADDDDTIAQAARKREALQRAVEEFDHGPVQRWGAFSIGTAIRQGQIWRFVTFQFLHGSFMHILFNMVGLYFFGPIIEAHFLGRRYLAFYLLCGVAGAVSFVLLNVTNVVPGNMSLVGASAGVIGLLVASAIIAPHVRIYAFMTISITIRTAAILAMLFALYAVIEGSGNNAGGEAAHLGGGVLGFLLIKNQHWLNPFAKRHSARIRRVAPGRRATVRKGWAKDWSKDFNR